MLLTLQSTGLFTLQYTGLFTLQYTGLFPLPSTQAYSFSRLFPERGIERVDGTKNDCYVHVNVRREGGGWRDYEVHVHVYVGEKKVGGGTIKFMFMLV